MAWANADSFVKTRIRVGRHSKWNADRYRARTRRTDGRIEGLDGWKDASERVTAAALTHSGGSSVDGLDKVAHVEPLWAP